jgi:dihydrofolate reductase
MRKLVVKEWMTLDGVIDADTMDEWWNPYDSVERQAYITEGYLGMDGYLLGRISYELLAPTWSRLEEDEVGGVAGKLNSVQKYVVSSTLKSVDWRNSTIISGNVVEEVTRLKQQAGLDIVLDGWPSR